MQTQYINELLNIPELHVSQILFVDHNLSRKAVRERVQVTQSVHDNFTDKEKQQLFTTLCEKHGFTRECSCH